MLRVREEQRCKLEQKRAAVTDRILQERFESQQRSSSSSSQSSAFFQRTLSTAASTGEKPTLAQLATMFQVKPTLADIAEVLGVEETIVSTIANTEARLAPVSTPCAGSAKSLAAMA